MSTYIQDFKEMPRLANPEQALKEYNLQTVPTSWYFIPETFKPVGTCSDTLEEFVKEIDENYIPFSKEHLRRYVIKAMGVEPKKNVENIIVLGCGHTFIDVPAARSLFQLCYILGLECAVLDHEYCCGATAALDMTRKFDVKAGDSVAKFSQKNIDSAMEAGAKNVYYFCRGCSAMAQRYARENDPPLQYFLDILTEPLKKVGRLKAKPAKVGYFRGCWTTTKSIYPDAKLNFDTWRSWLDQIEGLEVVDLKNPCCLFSAQSIQDEAVAAGCDYIVTTCAACTGKLNDSPRAINAKLLHEVILDAILYKG